MMLGLDLLCCVSPRCVPRHADIVLETIPPRDELFAQLEALNWKPVAAALRHAVATVDEQLLLLGGNTYALPAFPSLTPTLVHESRRQTWALRVAYFGPAFRGFAWQRDSPLETVAGRLQEALTPLLGGKSCQLSVAGRTDAGVSAIGQLVSFYSWPQLTEEQIRAAIDGAAPDGSLRLLSAKRVPRSYHATFSTRWRRYVYLLPMEPSLGVSAEAMRAQLEPLVGRRRDYAALGRGVPKGKETTCLLHHVDVRTLTLPSEANGDQGGEGAPVLRIELVGDRFIRRQVRTLVASAVLAVRLDTLGASQPHPPRPPQPTDADVDGRVRLNSADALDSACASSLLLRMATSGVQRETAHPAPAVGLMFAGAGGEDDEW